MNPLRGLMRSGDELYDARFNTGLNRGIMTFSQPESYESLLLSLKPAVWFDISDPTTRFQETTGASATTLATLDGDPVGSLKDKSGNNYYATAAADSQRPTLKLCQQNGLPGLLGDGVDDYLLMTGMTTVTFPYTIFCVGRFVTATGMRDIYDGAVVNQCALRYTVNGTSITTGPFLGILAGGNSIQQFLNSTRLYVTQINGTRCRFWIDNVLRAGPPSSNSTLSMTGVTLLASGGGSQNWHNGLFHEIFILRGLSDDQTINKVAIYLGKKWGIKTA